MSAVAVHPWRAAEADALEAKAECVEIAIERLEAIQGIYVDTSQRRHEVRNFIEGLKLDAENMRNEAKRIRDGGDLKTVKVVS